MPYIKTQRREALNSESYGAEDPGELNYILTQICQSYANNAIPRYRTFNEVIGVLECVKQEFYRRVIVPYEDKKCIENGDVYCEFI